jgi:hypothetical protein
MMNCRTASTPDVTQDKEALDKTFEVNPTVDRTSRNWWPMDDTKQSRTHLSREGNGSNCRSLHCH